MDRIIQTTGAAWFMTRPVTYPVEIILNSDKPPTNAERMRLSMAMDTMLKGMLDAGLPTERLRQQPGGDPMQYLRDPQELKAGTIIDCARPTELGQVHGLVTKHTQGELKAEMTDLAPVFGENPADRAEAMARATDAATASAVAIANQVGIQLGELVGAHEIRADRPAGASEAERINVRLRCSFAIA
ncbi:MAG: hypothetical protein AAFN27_15150 [Pseudomonadota bacterium]